MDRKRKKKRGREGERDIDRDRDRQTYMDKDRQRFCLPTHQKHDIENDHQQLTTATKRHLHCSIL